MNTRTLNTRLAAAVAALITAVFSARPPVTAESAYPRMAPVERYLIAGSTAEIMLARSAAPEAVSRHASILVLGKHGYRTASTGSNGFVCLVERSWMSPFDSPEFWNPRIRGPVCYNPPAASTVLKYTLYRTSLALSGVDERTMHGRIASRIAQHVLPAPAPGAMSYMMSKDGYLNDAAGHWHPHLMFHVRTASAASWGANLPGSPVLIDDEHLDVPEQETIFMVPVARWSDGTAATSKGAM